MLGFNLKERFERIYSKYVSGDLSREEEWAVAEEFGDDLEFFKKQDEQTQKELYIKLQTQKHSAKLEICPQILTSQDDTYYSLYTDEEFDEFIKNYKQENYKDEIDIDERIIFALSNLSYLKKQDLSNLSVKKKMSGCYDIIRTHIKNGYNIYPLIKLLNANVAEHKKRYPQDCQKGGDMYERVVSDMNAVQTLELLEMHSPYVQFINASNSIGEFITEQKKLEKQGNYEEADKIAENIEKIKEQLRARFNSYDPEFLENFLNDRKNYLRKEPEKQEEFLGAMEVLKTLVFYKKRQKDKEIG